MRNNCDQCSVAITIENSNTVKNNYSMLIPTLIITPQYAAGSNDDQSFLASSPEFSTSEIEVYTKVWYC